MKEFLTDDPENPQTLAAIPIALNDPVDGKRFSDNSTRGIEEFLAPRVRPLDYPGKRPELSFLADEEGVYPVKAIELNGNVQFGLNTVDGVYDLDDLLTFYGAELMKDRIPIIGFGSNASPGQLVEKFSEVQDAQGDITNPIDRRFVPAIRASVKDVVPVYSSKIGIRGYVFAELHEEPGIETEAFVTFLSPGQLKRMIRSEGAYKLCELHDLHIDGLEQPIAGYSFVGKNEIILDENGSPIRVMGTKSTSEIPGLTQEELLTDLASHYGAGLNAQYSNAHQPVADARSLAALMVNRKSFIRPEDPKIGVTLQELLRKDGRVSTDKFLDSIAPEKQDVSPKTFGELYSRYKENNVE